MQKKSWVKSNFKKKSTKHLIPVMNYLERMIKPRQKATRMAQISFPTPNAHKHRRSPIVQSRTKNPHNAKTLL